jgi:hypothetical protein
MISGLIWMLALSSRIFHCSSIQGHFGEVLLQEFVHEAIASADALEEQTLGAVVEEFVVAVGSAVILGEDNLESIVFDMG